MIAFKAARAPKAVSSSPCFFGREGSCFGAGTGLRIWPRPSASDLLLGCQGASW